MKLSTEILQQNFVYYPAFFCHKNIFIYHNLLLLVIKIKKHSEVGKLKEGYEKRQKDVREEKKINKRKQSERERDG